MRILQQYINQQVYTIITNDIMGACTYVFCQNRDVGKYNVCIRSEPHSALSASLIVFKLIDPNATCHAPFKYKDNIQWPPTGKIVKVNGWLNLLLIPLSPKSAHTKKYFICFCQNRTGNNLSSILCYKCFVRYLCMASFIYLQILLSHYKTFKKCKCRSKAQMLLGPFCINTFINFPCLGNFSHIMIVV